MAQPSELTLQRSPPVNRQARRRASPRRKSQNLERHAGVQPLSYTVAAWCAAHNFSRSFFEKLKREGRGPRVLREGKIVRITPAADAEWTAAREGN